MSDILLFSFMFLGFFFKEIIIKHVKVFVTSFCRPFKWQIAFLLVKMIRVRQKLCAIKHITCVHVGISSFFSAGDYVRQRRDHRREVRSASLIFVFIAFISCSKHLSTLN